jgi:hypothetical protein
MLDSDSSGASDCESSPIQEVSLVPQRRSRPERKRQLPAKFRELDELSDVEELRFDPSSKFMPHARIYVLLYCRVHESMSTFDLLTVLARCQIGRYSCYLIPFSKSMTSCGHACWEACYFQLGAWNLILSIQL